MGKSVNPHDPVVDAKAFNILGSRMNGWVKDPILFCADQWGLKLWERQQEIIRKAWVTPRLAVKAGHGVGKSYALAQLAIAFLVCYPKSRVITTAPTWTQVEKILWAELKGAVKKMKIPIGGVPPLNTELRLDDDWFALGLSTDEVDRFQGFHAASVLVIFDEASGIPAPLWEAADSLMAGSHTRWLVVGNPLEAEGPFWKCFQPESGWETMTISCWDSPNVVSGQDLIPGLVSRQWVEGKKEDWGEESPLYASRVLGQFPAVALTRVIPRASVENCIGRIPSAHGRFISADIADFGEDETVMYGWEDGRIVRQSIYGKVAAMETAGNLVTFADALDADAIILDATGLGAPVEQRVRELTRRHVVGIKSQEKAQREDMLRNMRAEVWWTSAEVLARGGAGLPDDPKLLADLTAPTYAIRNGKVIVVDKEIIKREIGRSPDRGDACTLGLWWLAQPQSQDLFAGGLYARETSTQAAMRKRREEQELVLSGGAGYGESDG